MTDNSDLTALWCFRWREKLARSMTTNKVQYTIIALVVLDSVIVIFELLIDMEIIKSEYKELLHRQRDSVGK